MACKIVICNREIKDSRRINGLVHVVKHPGKTILVAQNKVEPVAEAAQAGRGGSLPLRPPSSPHFSLLFFLCLTSPLPSISPLDPPMHYYRICLCSRSFVPVAFGPGTIGGFCPGSKG